MTFADIKRWLTSGDNGYDYRPKPDSIRVMRDPQVAGTYAVRFEDERNGTTDLMFITQYEEGTTAEILERCLEEVEYSSWPPSSGPLQFFT